MRFVGSKRGLWGIGSDIVRRGCLKDLEGMLSEVHLGNLFDVIQTVC